MERIEPAQIDILELDSARRRICRRWLQLGVLSLGLAGVFAVLLVVARMPGSEAFFPWLDFFHTSLVVHVDQSVLIWFLSMTGLVWAMFTPQARGLALWHRSAYTLALIGTVGVALSAFFGEGAPLMNNYVPVLQRPFFFYMLGVFALGMFLQSLPALGCGRNLFNAERRIHLPSLAALTLSLALLVSLAGLAIAWWQIPAKVEGQGYYEYLFWGGGHTLQFAYTQLLMLAWLLLVRHIGVRLPGDGWWYAALLLLGVAPVLATPLIYLFFDTLTIESRTAFTIQMQYGNGLAAVPLGLLVLWGLLKTPAGDSVYRPVRRSLWMSLLLFFAGGLIALFISGVNTIIPAHYHGSIVGVTLALMGLAYLLLPRLGYAPAKGVLADWQPWIYGIGQLLHIIGLAVSGAMGVQRKTAGAAQGLDSLSVKLTMFIGQAGGGVAVIGGVLFVWVMIRAFMRPAESASPAVKG